MAKTFGELQALALQIRDEILEKKNTAPRVGAALLDMIDNTIQNITDINQKLSVFEHACSGFKRVQSELHLPLSPSPEEKGIGYLIGRQLYLYVAQGGNAVGGRYFNVGEIVGPPGEVGPQGLRGYDGQKGDKGDGFQPNGFINSIAEMPGSGYLGETYIVGNAEPYQVYMYNGSAYINIGSLNEVRKGVYDGGRADSNFGGTQGIDCGKA